MIAISTVLYDVDGNFTFQDKDISLNDLTNKNVSRRISKVKTLDGKVFIDDSGYAAGDVDIVITLKNPTHELYALLRDIFIYHAFVNVMSDSGNFLCVPDNIKLKNGNAVMVFATKESI